MTEIRDVFLSHASADKAFVRRLADDIEDCKDGGTPLKAWIDEGEIRIGQSVVAAINQGLEASRFVAFVMTPNYFQSPSGWTDAEWHAALYRDPDNRNERLVPIYAANCPHVPILLRHLARIDLRASNYEQELVRLKAMLRGQPLTRSSTNRGRIIDSSGMVARTSIIAEQIPARSEPDQVAERLSSNLLPIVKLPSRVYSARVVSTSLRKGVADWESKKHLKERIYATAKERKIKLHRLPPFRMSGETLYSFNNLGKRQSLFSGVLRQGSIGNRSAASFLHNSDDKLILVSLLNLTVNRYCLSLGLQCSYEPGRGWRYFFPPATGNTERKIRWTPSRRAAVRTVTKPLSQTDSKAGWLHAGAYLDVSELGGQFFLKVRPTWLLTVDGHNPKSGPNVGRIINRWTNRERNLAILYHLRFWSTILAKGQKNEISMKAGRDDVVLSVLPAQIALPVGINHDMIDSDRLLDVEATLMAEIESELVISAMEFAAEEEDETEVDETDDTGIQDEISTDSEAVEGVITNE